MGDLSRRFDFSPPFGGYSSGIFWLSVAGLDIDLFAYKLTFVEVSAIEDESLSLLSFKDKFVAFAPAGNER